MKDWTPERMAAYRLWYSWHMDNDPVIKANDECGGIALAVTPERRKIIRKWMIQDLRSMCLENDIQELLDVRDDD